MLRQLYYTHSLTADKYLFADLIGGFACPSLAISTNDNPPAHYGGIVLVKDPLKINLSDFNVYNSDSFSAKMPEIFWELDHGGLKNLRDSVIESLSSLGVDQKVISKSIFYKDDFYDNSILEDGLYIKNNRLKSNTSLRLSYLLHINPELKLEGVDLGSPNSISDFIDIKFEKINHADFHAWLDEKLDRFIHSPYFYDSKDRKRTATLENLTAAMKSHHLCADNDFLSKLGLVIAASSKKLSSEKQIIKNSDRLITRENEKNGNDVIEDLKVSFAAICDDMMSNYNGDVNSFSYLNDASDCIINFAKSKGKVYEIEKQFTADPAMLEKINKFIEVVRQAPVEYFEMKGKTSFPIKYFDYAIVPANTDPDIIKNLQGKKLKVLRYNNDSEKIRCLTKTKCGFHDLGNFKLDNDERMDLEPGL